MLDTKDFYNAILVRGRRSNPTFDQVRQDARKANGAQIEANLYRF